MSRAQFVTRQFRCMRCCGSHELSTQHFTVQYWSGAREFGGRPLTPQFRDLKCPLCGANPAWFESWPRVCASFILPMRESLRPVVFRRVDASGREHYRYPASTDAAIRPSEERVDFPTLRSLESFLKEQNPNYRDWQVPLNDILDYDNPDTAINDYDPGAAEDVEAVELGDGGGITSEREVEEFMQRDDARALIESL